MRIRLSIIALFVALLPANGQDIEDTLSKMPPTRLVFTERTFDRNGLETSSMTGSAEVQYPCFSVSYGSTIICGDGKTIWFRDIKSDEVTISGGNVIKAIFSDKSIKVDMKKGSATMSTPDGGHGDFQIVFSEEMESRWPESHFRMDPSTFGPDTIITDLR